MGNIPPQPLHGEFDIENPYVSNSHEKDTTKSIYQYYQEH